MCRAIPKQGDMHFCGKTCAEEAVAKGPFILEVPEGHVTFVSGKRSRFHCRSTDDNFFPVAEQFKASWRHGGKVCPPVKGVFKIIGSQSSLAKYDAYRLLF